MGLTMSWLAVGSYFGASSGERISDIYAFKAANPQISILSRLFTPYWSVVCMGMRCTRYRRIRCHWPNAKRIWSLYACDLDPIE